jgi:hypothetical protein
MTLETATANDKVEVKELAKPHPDSALSGVDRIKLLQEGTPQRQADTANLHDFAIDGLHDDGGKKGAGGGSGLRGFTEVGVSPTSNSGTPHDADSPAPATEIVKRTGDDLKAPTAVFVDEFIQKTEPLGDGTDVAHGEVSRTAAEKIGFNTVALQSDGIHDINGDQDFSKPLNDVARGIDDGTLKGLGSGDVVNVSMGNDDQTFKEFNEKFLGVPNDSKEAITRDNLASRTDDIIRRARAISEDPSRNEAARVKAKRIVDTNDAIDNLKAKGIQVLHAAGNDGPDRFSPDFLHATELASVNLDGTADSFSADNSLTKGANGVFPVHVTDGADLLSPTPLADQTSNLEIGNTGVKFPSKAGLLTEDNRIFDRNSVDLKADLKPIDRPLDSSFFKPEPMLTDGSNFQATSSTGTATTSFRPGQEAAVGQVGGTSFVNIDFLKYNFEQLKALKDAGGVSNELI